MAMKPRHSPKAPPAFDVEAFLASSGAAGKVELHPKRAIVFAQGDKANDVRYVQKGTIKLTVVSTTGKEAVVAVIGTGDFFGEGVLAGQPVRMATARAMTTCRVLVIRKDDMTRLLQQESDLSDRFITHMLARNIRIEADLVDQLFNSSEKRLARVLLLLGRYADANSPQTLPRVSQELLAEMIGSTRSRVNFFMNKFRKLGLIEYDGRITINRSLLSVVLHD
jgi:CRP/FNR family cyclic AMP-dependent transcriptional regulator